MPTVFSNPPRKGQPARIWHLEEVWEHAKRLPVFQKPLAELNSLEEVACYGSEYHFGRLTVREVAEHSRRIHAATFERPIISSREGLLGGARDDRGRAIHRGSAPESCELVA